MIILQQLVRPKWAQFAMRFDFCDSVRIAVEMNTLQMAHRRRRTRVSASRAHSMRNCLHKYMTRCDESNKALSHLKCTIQPPTCN